MAEVTWSPSEELCTALTLALTTNSVSPPQNSKITVPEKQQLASSETAGYAELEGGAVTQFWLVKYEKEASRNWDLFYKRNGVKFFKDRHWLDREFEELDFGGRVPVDKPTRMMEVGCGVGNAFWPMLEINPRLTIFCFDFSQRAVQLVKDNSSYDPARMTAFHCDVATTDIPHQFVPAGTLDLALMCFMLSAVSPELHADCVRRVASVSPAFAVLFAATVCNLYPE
jgi:methyltransferase-like protein 6